MPLPASESKTALICQLLAAGLSKGQIQARVGCSQALVYKVLKGHAGEIALLKTGQPPIPVARDSQVPPVLLPPLPDRRMAALPNLDPAQPVAPQLEGMAWTIIAEAAAGGDITVKQANAAREIIKQALRDKVPPPISRRLQFRISEIDVAPPGTGHDFHVVNSQVFEVKP